MDLDFSCSLNVSWEEVWELCPAIQWRIGSPVNVFIDTSSSGLKASRLLIFCNSSIRLPLSNIIVALGTLDLTPESYILSTCTDRQLFQSLGKQQSLIVAEANATPLINSRISHNIRNISARTGSGTTLSYGFIATFTAFSSL